MVFGPIAVSDLQGETFEKTNLERNLQDRVASKILVDHVLQAFQRANLDLLAGGLRLDSGRFFCKWIDAGSLFRGRLEFRDDLAKTWDRELLRVRLFAF